jgi:hypothetical protein
VISTTLCIVHAATELETFLRWHLHVGFDLVLLFFDCDCDCPEEQAAIQVAQKQDWAGRVLVTFSTEHLREQQRLRGARWHVLHPFLHQVPARQELNVESALALAASQGVSHTHSHRTRRLLCHARTQAASPHGYQSICILCTHTAELRIVHVVSTQMRWLLHIDADELFLPTAGEGPDAGLKAWEPDLTDSVRLHYDALDAAGVGHVTYKNVEAVAEGSKREAGGAEAQNVFREVSMFRQV